MIHACWDVGFDTTTSDKVQAGRTLGNNKCEWKLGSEMQQMIRKLRTSSEAGTLGLDRYQHVALCVSRVQKAFVLQLAKGGCTDK